jgi:hypothetical protein
MSKTSDYTNLKENISKPLSTVHTKSLNSPSSLSYDRQGSCEALSGTPTGQQRLVKTLAEVDTPSKSGLAGATEIPKHHLATDNPAVSKILEYAWTFKKSRVSQKQQLKDVLKS